MKNAGLTPVKVSGGGTLASLYLLVQTVSRKDGKGLADTDSGSRLLGILRKTVLKTDSILGFVGGFTGHLVGVKGIKSTRV